MASYILQESGFKILLADGSGSILTADSTSGGGGTSTTSDISGFFLLLGFGLLALLFV